MASLLNVGRGRLLTALQLGMKSQPQAAAESVFGSYRQRALTPHKLHWGVLSRQMPCGKSGSCPSILLPFIWPYTTNTKSMYRIGN